MNPFVTQEELSERCKDPKFCIACFRSRDNVKIDAHHVCETCRTGSTANPIRLPAVTLKSGKTYFFDRRLRQFRNIHNPHDFIDLRGVVQ
jgi:hypothetical protein